MKAKTLASGLLLIGLTFSVIGFWLLQKPTPAPNVTFTTITGKKIELLQLRGKPVIVTFWATDCAGCIKEVPHLIELYKQFHSQGLEIIAVAMYYDPPNHVVEMTKAKQIPYHVALDLKAQHATAFGQVQLTPTSFLISPAGKVILQKTGEFDFFTMQQQIKKLIQG